MAKCKEKEPLTFEYEKTSFPSAKIVCGTDEAGRGPLVGPVVAGACILPEGVVIEGLNDSKKISEKKREALYDKIIESAISYSIKEVSPEVIDEINILQATYLAMERAINNLSVKPDFLLIDGNRAKDFKIPTETIVGGDGLSASIAAASILAKVARDRDCIELDAQYPQYSIAKHKGYGTKAHYEAVDKYGLCKEHRPSFFKKYFENVKGSIIMTGNPVSPSLSASTIFNTV